jgi:hypothetical protein
MVVSSNSALTTPSVNCCRNALCETFGQLQPMPEKLNETGTLVSERVHVREIVVIRRIDWLRDNPVHFGWSLAVRRWRRYKRRNSHQRFSRMRSWRLSVPFRLSSPTRPPAI